MEALLTTGKVKGIGVCNVRIISRFSSTTFPNLAPPPPYTVGLCQTFNQLRMPVIASSPPYYLLVQ